MNTGNLIRAFKTKLEQSLVITTAGQLTKLQEELDELKATTDTEEFHRELADVVIVAMMAAECSGLRVEKLLHYVDEKMVINLSRVWAASAEGTAHHV